MRDQLSLPLVAARLEALEETIIMRFLDRAQFAINRIAYTPGKSGFEGAGEESLFELRLASQERMDAEFGRFMVPEERPVSEALPAPRRKVHLPHLPLGVSDANIVRRSPEIRDAYLEIIPSLCNDDDDGQYGSAVEHDVYTIQAIARRVHYGALYVAEAKYRERSNEYRDAARSGDREALRSMLTRADVEARILERLEKKVRDLQIDVNKDVRRVIGSDVIVSFYRNTIIPLTKSGQISYLMARAR